MKSEDSVKIFMTKKSDIKITDVVKLVKYAQGGIVFNSFLSYLEFLKPAERQIFLLQLTELISHFTMDDSMVDLTIKRSDLANTCSACLLLNVGVNENQLSKIAKLPDTELKSSFKLLLTLFSIVYQEGYQKNRNSATKFWYWDYSEEQNVYNLIELDYKQYVKVDDILWP